MNDRTNDTDTTAEAARFPIVDSQTGEPNACCGEPSAVCALTDRLAAERAKHSKEQTK